MGTEIFLTMKNIVLKINWTGIKGLLPFGFIALYSRLVGIG